MAAGFADADHLSQCALIVRDGREIGVGDDSVKRPVWEGEVEAVALQERVGVVGVDGFVQRVVLPGCTLVRQVHEVPVVFESHKVDALDLVAEAKHILTRSTSHVKYVHAGFKVDAI